MILSDFVLSKRANQCYEFSGIDSPEHCLDSMHFENYPHPITYQYNSRGFRDSEWPCSIEELQQCIWCLGDSFTVGIGSPLAHTWPAQLTKHVDQRIINVSMDGASNEWLARKTSDIMQSIAPKLIIIHWSYTHRREKDKEPDLDLKYSKFYNDVRDQQWPDSFRYKDFYKLPQEIQKELIEVFDMYKFVKVPDEDRIIHYSKNSTVEKDTQNTIGCIDYIEQQAQQNNINLIHSFIPEFAPADQIPVIEKYLSASDTVFVPPFDRLDLARDGHRYDIITARDFVKKITSVLAHCANW